MTRQTIRNFTYILKSKSVYAFDKMVSDPNVKPHLVAYKKYS